MSRDEKIMNAINKIAGRNLYKDGFLNRTELASLIFNDPHLLAEVNALVHPVVFANFEKWADEQTSPYSDYGKLPFCLKAVLRSLVDRIVTVVAPMEERLARVIRGNKLSREQVLEG